ncbi:MAG: hypothetical protein RLZZ385_846 [Pseudomonadota bacterium]|jgi:hypothetical protein
MNGFSVVRSAVVGALSLAGVVILAQSEYSANLLEQKSSFMAQGAQALGEPFRGITTSGGLTPGLFPLRHTGVSTAAVREAAAGFLATLQPADLSRVQFAVSDPEWRNWSNVDIGIFARHGLSLEEMDPQQKAAAWNLLRSSLSEQGLEQTIRIMRTEVPLLELNNEPIRYGEEKYYFTVMGIPSADEPWGWQLDGHHLVINFFVLGDQVVMTPAFWGGEPVFTTSGRHQGNVILQEEQDLGLAFMQSLNDGQRARATLAGEKVRNAPMAAANADNLTLDFAGIPGRDLDSRQRLALLGLIREYVGNLRTPHAEVTMEEIGAHLDDTWFAWIGTAADDAVFYYRIHSPVILIEFDHQNPVGTPYNPRGVPTRDHIHTVVRTPNGNDYGKDLLAQHLAAHPH